MEREMWKGKKDIEGEKDMDREEKKIEEGVY